MSRESRVWSAVRSRTAPVVSFVLDCALIALSCVEHAQERWADRHRPLEDDVPPSGPNANDRSAA